MAGKLKIYEKAKEILKRNYRVHRLALISLMTASVLLLTSCSNEKGVDPEPVSMVTQMPITSTTKNVEWTPFIEGTSEESSIQRDYFREISVKPGTFIRIKPSNDQSHIVTAGKNNTGRLVVDDKENGWALIAYNLGENDCRLGYVPSNSIIKLYGDAHGEVELSSGYLQFTEPVRIRNRMSTADGTALITAKADDCCQVIGENVADYWEDKWYVVSYTGYDYKGRLGTFIGYVCSDHIKFIPESKMKTAINQLYPAIRIKGNNVNFRKTQSMSGNVKARLNSGDIALLIDENDDWYHVYYHMGQEGYQEGYISKTVDYCIERTSTRIVPDGLRHVDFDEESDLTKSK